MSTMADVIAAHTADWVDWETSMTDPDYYRCLCGTAGWHVNSSTDYHQAHAEHVAAELAKAGYGNMADAWDEGYGACRTRPSIDGYLINRHQPVPEEPVMSEPTPEAIEAAKEAMREVTPPPGVSKADWLTEHGEFALIAGALSAAAPYLIREAQAKALEQVAEDWEALVRREKPPIRGYIFLRARAAAIRDGDQ